MPGHELLHWKDNSNPLYLCFNTGEIMTQSCANKRASGLGQAHEQRETDIDYIVDQV